MLARAYLFVGNSQRAAEVLAELETPADVDESLAKQLTELREAAVSSLGGGGPRAAAELLQRVHAVLDQMGSTRRNPN